MTIWKYYHLAENITDALRALAEAPESVRVIAGGTDLLLDLQQGRHPPVHTLVDITRVPEMTALEIRGEHLFVGAAVPLNLVVASPLIREHAPALMEAAGLIGGPQVRNTATLGGNVAHALPAGDGTISLLALDAQAEIASQGGYRKEAMRELFSGPGRSRLDARHDLLVGFYIPLRGADEGSAFRRIMRPQGVAIAILNMGVWLRREGDVIADIRIGVGPAGPIPFRATMTEDTLRTQVMAEATVDRATETLLTEARFRTSPHRSTAEYRKDMSAVLLRETTSAAWQRTRLKMEDLKVKGYEEAGER
jgi:carbon-monoxide dehydrogenase medium subunit